MQGEKSLRKDEIRAAMRCMGGEACGARRR